MSNLFNLRNLDSPSFQSNESTFKPEKSLNKYFFNILNKKTVGKKQFLFTKYDSTIKSEELSFA